MMPTPNLNYYPMVEPLPGGTAFLDGWETTLAADWNGNEPPAMTDWINLDTVLIQWKAMATVVMEWTSDSKTYRQMVALFPSQGVIRGGMIPGGMANDVPPVSDTGFTVIPAGARVYMPLMARDIQLLVNHAPLTLSYIAQNGEWQAVFSGMFPLRQPTGQQYTLPATANSDPILAPELTSLPNMSQADSADLGTCLEGLGTYSTTTTGYTTGAAGDSSSAYPHEVAIAVPDIPVFLTDPVSRELAYNITVAIPVDTLEMR